MKPSKTYTLPLVTEADRVGDFAHYTLDTIAGVLLIKSLTDAELQACARRTKTLAAVCLALGPTTNPCWIKNAVYTEMYDRQLIDHTELHAAIC